MSRPSLHLSCALALLVPLLLAGCGTLGNKLTPGIEPDPVMARLDERIDLTPYLKQGSTLTAEKCDALQTELPDSAKIEEFGRLAAYAHCAGMHEAKKAEGKSKNPWLGRVADQSIRLIRSSCEAYFDRLENRRVRVQYHQNNVNIGVGAVTAILASFAGHTRAIFNLAAAATAGNALTENYKSNFILTPELAKLHDKIKAELFDPKEAEITSRATEDKYRTLAELATDLAEFEDLCSHKKLIQLVAKSIDVAKFDFEGPGFSPQIVAETRALKEDIRKAGSFESIPSDAQLQSLAALAESDEATRKKVIDHLAATSGAATVAQALDTADGTTAAATLLNQAKALKLDQAAGATSARKLNRLADALKWSDQDGFAARKAMFQALAMAPAPAASQTGSTPKPAGGKSSPKAPGTAAPPSPLRVPGLGKALEREAGSASGARSSDKINFRIQVRPNSDPTR